MSWKDQEKLQINTTELKKLSLFNNFVKKLSNIHKQAKWNGVEDCPVIDSLSH